jgi:hypothetical protein
VVIVMNLKNLVMLSLKIVALTLLQMVCFTVAALIVMPRSVLEQRSSEDGGPALVLICFLNTLILAYFILRSRSGGWKLIAAVFFVFYGVMTVMPQVETAFFLTTRLPPGTVPRLFAMGAIVAGIFSPVAVLLLRRRKQDESIVAADSGVGRVTMPATQWLWTLALIAAVYVTLYFTFGYFIAWQSPAVRAYYGSSGDSPGFFEQMGTVLRETPSLVPFQVLRALMWTAFALPIISMIRGRRWEGAILLGLLFAVVTSDQLLLPNPYMPQEVRMAHLVETATSNFIFGVIVSWLLYKGPTRNELPRTEYAV